MTEYKQLIIARKDLQMSPGKLAAQVAHGSMAFIANLIKKNSEFYEVDDTTYYTTDNPEINYRNPELRRFAIDAYNKEHDPTYFHAKIVDGKGVLCDPEPEKFCLTFFKIDPDIYENWFLGSFTKVVLGAENRTQLLKACTLAD